MVSTTTWIQLFSIVGALLVLSAFAASQYAGMRTDGLSYGLLNLTGSTLLAFSALTPPNVGVLLVEGAWALLSLGVTLRALTTAAAPASRGATITPD